MPEPGDFFVAPNFSRKLIHRFRGRVIATVTGSKFVHTAIYIGKFNDLGLVVEAIPQGVVISPLRAFDGQVWSTGLIQLDEDQRASIVKTALERVGSPYSYSKVLAAGLYQRNARPGRDDPRASPEAPRWIRRAASGSTYDCSSLVVDCYRTVGVEFLPTMVSYRVRPSDLHVLLEGSRALVPGVA